MSSKLEDLVEKESPDFNLPPSRKEKREHFSRGLVNKWKEEFKKQCWFTPHFPTASFHVLVGQLPNVKDIRINVGQSTEDCRIHMLLLQESGSGKGGGFSFMADICERLNVIFHNLGDATNSSLVGSIKPIGDGKTEVIPGALSPRYNDGEGVDIVACNEASSVIDTRSEHYDKNAILNLQRAMNPMDSADNMITKETGVGNETIKYNTDVSLYLTTFEPERMTETITKTGFFQRMLVVYNPISLKDKIKVGKRHAMLLENNVKKTKDRTDEIIHALRYINNEFDGVDSLSLTKGARQLLRNKVLPLIYKPLLKLESNTMDEAKKFATRYQVMLYKIAWHRAIIRLSKTVEKKDIVYAKKFFIPIYKRLLAWMENKYSPDGEERVKSAGERKLIIKTYKQLVKKAEADIEGTWIKKPYLVQILSKKWGKSRESARQKMEKHVYLFKTKISNSNSILLKLRKQYR